MLIGKYLLAHTLHSITGNKYALKITRRLGHCETYDQLLGNEPAQTQEAVKLVNDFHKSVLLQSSSDEDTILAVFWTDTFN